MPETISEKDLMLRLAEALDVKPEALQPTTKASDIQSWDSMGTMLIVFLLRDTLGIELEPQDTSRLQSVENIVQLVRKAGCLE